MTGYSARGALIGIHNADPTTDPTLAAAPPAQPAEETLPLRVRIVNLAVVASPLLALALALVLFWDRGFNWLHLGLLVGMYIPSVLGLTVGFHRLFTHRAFETPRPVKAVLAIFGSLAFQGPLIKWVAMHRIHHQHSDRPGDPHSPHGHGNGIVAMLKGLWHAHIGWIFGPDPKGLDRYAADLRSDTMLRRVSALFPLWAAIGVFLPAVIAGLVTMTWTGAVLGLVWGGIARLFLVQHITWSINSVCHFWGGRPFRSHDHSRNNLIFGIIGMGEGWHNNHHAFPNSARHGLRWWQIDISYWVIRGMERVGLAWKIKLPAASDLAMKRV